MARLGFNPNEYEGVTGGEFEAFPDGEYQLKCTAAEMKDTNAGDGQYISGEFEVVGPTSIGRKMWHNFNVVNKSEKSQNFSRRMVSGWARACGRPNAKDTDELLERKFMAIVGIEKGTGGYKDKNILTGFLETGEADKPVPRGHLAPMPVAEPAAEVAPPPPPAEVVQDPFEGLAPHVAPAVAAAGGLGTPSGDSVYAALAGKPAPVTAVKPATVVAAKAAPAAAKPAAAKSAPPAPTPAPPPAAAGKSDKAPWDD